jgi:hypothetical protein
MRKRKRIYVDSGVDVILTELIHGQTYTRHRHSLSPSFNRRSVCRFAIATAFAELQSPLLSPSCNRRSVYRFAIAAAVAELQSPQLSPSRNRHSFRRAAIASAVAELHSPQPSLSCNRHSVSSRNRLSVCRGVQLAPSCNRYTGSAMCSFRISLRADNGCPLLMCRPRQQGRHPEESVITKRCLARNTYLRRCGCSPWTRFAC